MSGASIGAYIDGLMNVKGRDILGKAKDFFNGVKKMKSSKVFEIFYAAFLSSVLLQASIIAVATAAVFSYSMISLYPLLLAKKYATTLINSGLKLMWYMEDILLKSSSALANVFFGTNNSLAYRSLSMINVLAMQTLRIAYLPHILFSTAINIVLAPLTVIPEYLGIVGEDSRLLIKGLMNFPITGFVFRPLTIVLGLLGIKNESSSLGEEKYSFDDVRAIVTASEVRASNSENQVAVLKAKNEMLLENVRDLNATILPILSAVVENDPNLRSNKKLLGSLAHFQNYLANTAKPQEKKKVTFPSLKLFNK